MAGPIKAVGSKFSIASTYGAPVNMTAISNATSAVATLAAGHGVVVGDFLEVSSGWGLLDKRIVRASVVATNDVTFESINTSDTDQFLPSSGTGTIRRITAWTQLTLLTPNFTVAGGDQNFANTTTLDDVIEKQMPTTRSPIKVSMPVFDDPSAAWYSTVRGVAESAALTALRIVFPGGSRLVGNGYWSLQPVPVPEDSTLRGLVEVSFGSAPTRYAT